MNKILFNIFVLTSAYLLCLYIDLSSLHSQIVLYEGLIFLTAGYIFFMVVFFRLVRRKR